MTSSKKKTKGQHAGFRCRGREHQEIGFRLGMEGCARTLALALGIEYEAFSRTQWSKRVHAFKTADPKIRVDPPRQLTAAEVAEILELAR
jgi:hypothetical protein